MTHNLILKESNGFGKLYLGSFKAVINRDFMRKENVKGVLNTVGDRLFSDSFGKNLKSTYESVIESEQVSLLCMQWEDSLQYDITYEDISKCVKFIHDIRKTNGSIIVHCAQGKSRSATAVIAYLMALKKMSLKDALSFVQKRRKMAAPNPHFMYFLYEYETSDCLKELFQYCATTTLC